MADPTNPTILKIDQRLNQGYSLEELLAFAKENGLYEGEVADYFDSLSDPQQDEKKKSSSESASEEVSMESSLEDGVSDSQDEEPSSDLSAETFQGSLKDRRLDNLRGTLGKLENDNTALLKERDEATAEGTREAPQGKFTLASLMEGAPSDPYGDRMSSGQIQVQNEEDARIRHNELVGMTDSEVRQLAILRNEKDINLAESRYQAVIEGKDATKEIEGREDGFSSLIVRDENGELTVDGELYGMRADEMTDLQVRKTQAVKEEVSHIQELSDIGAVGYAFNTGMKSLGNSFLAIVDTEQAASNQYYNTSRSAASKESAGVSAEDVEDGIFGNLIQGDISAAGTMLGLAVVEQMPQLLAQAAVAIGTGAMGNTAMRVGQGAFMGGSAMGGTMASYKGMVSDDLMYGMAVGDAMVEFVSESLFVSDVKAIVGPAKLGKMTMKEVRNKMFKKGILSSEFGEVAARAGIDLAKTGGEEFVEEIIAGVGSAVVHAQLNDEEINLFEIMDGGLIGLGSGVAAGSKRGVQVMLNSGYSSLGFGGFRKELLKIQSTKQELTEQLQRTSDEVERGVLEAKLKDVIRLETVSREEQFNVYEQYTDEDASATVGLNQSLSNDMSKLKALSQEESSPEVDTQKADLANSIKENYTALQAIEAKYEVNVKATRAQNQQTDAFTAQMADTTEVTEDSQLPDSPLFNGIKNVKKALQRKGTKVFMHKNIDAAAKATGLNKLDIAGANGMFVDADNAIHILPSIAKNNTAYHEGYHKVLREVDPAYAKRFVDAAFEGMDDKTAVKYALIYKEQFDIGGVELAIEETFAELNADIANGEISVEGAGTSVARAAMGSLKNSLYKIGIGTRPQGTFKEFTNFVSSVTSDFKSGTQSKASRTQGQFGKAEVLTDNKVFYQPSKVEKLVGKQASSTVAELQQPTITIPKGKKFDTSLINDKTPTTNLATVVEDFRAENGRAPSILFWMGDQTGRGTYTTKNGTSLELEGGISYSVDSKNSDKGVVWATNKNHKEVQGMVKGADLVAIVSGSSQTGHKFYKKTTTVLLTEYMEAVNKLAGQTIVFAKAAKSKGSTATEVAITIPEGGFTDPILAFNSFNSQIQDSRKAGKSANFKKYWEKLTKFGAKKLVSEYTSLDQYLADVEGDRMHGITVFTEPTKEMDAFVEAIGMKPLADINTEMRDGYLVENGFENGDVYAYFKLEQDAKGETVTAEGNHGTYTTDIMGSLVGVANRKDNIYDMAALDQSTTTELPLSGRGKVDMLLGSNLKNNEGLPIVTEEALAEIDKLPTKEKNKEYSTIIAAGAIAAKKAGDKTTMGRLQSGNKGGYISADRAGDKSSKRVLADAGTLQDSGLILESLMFGQTKNSRVAALKQAANELVEEGEALEREFIIKNKDDERIAVNRSVLPVGKVVARANKNEGREAVTESEVSETNRKAGIFFQSAIISETVNMLRSRMTKAQILVKLQEKGLSRADANLVYAKAAQYSGGYAKGHKVGTRERSAHVAAARKQAREEESDKAKEARKQLQDIVKNEKLTTAQAVELIVKLVEAAGVTLRASQVSQLIKISSSVARGKGRGVLTDQGRFEVMNSVAEKVIAIINKEKTAQDLADHTNMVRVVSKAQRALSNKLRNLKSSTKSPLISYSEQILNLTSINVAMLSMDEAAQLSEALKEISNSTKTVSAKGGQVAGSYVEVEGMGFLDTRRAKIYFDEIYEQLRHVELTNQESTIVDQAVDAAYEKGTDWVAEYDLIMRNQTVKQISVAQKKLEDIAKEFGLDLNDVNELDQALDQLAEDNKEAINTNRKAVIEQAILPTFLNHRRILEGHPSFARIFAVSPHDNDSVAVEIVRSRMDKLTGLEAKKLEFAMYDYIVNGQAFGVQAIAAVVLAKNESSAAIKRIGLKATPFKTGKLQTFYELFETTPLFFRRIFKASPVKIAQFQDAIGYAELVQEASMADRTANEYVEYLAVLAKTHKQESLASQVRLQAYSVLTQKAKDVESNKHLLQVIASFELAVKKDMRFDKDQRAEVAKTVQDLFYNTDGSKKSLKEVMNSLESDKGAMQMIDDMRYSMEEDQLSRVRTYAHEFLGMKFKEEPNYLPISFRSIGSRDNDIEATTDKIENIQKSFNAHGLSKAQTQAKSTFERNELSIGSPQRYIDINIYSAVSSTFRENEIKIRTAQAVARISAATSETNEAFTDAVPDIETRQQIRQKAVQALLGNTSVSKSDNDTLGPWLSRSISYLNDVTVLWFFGTIYTQMFKQGAAILNTIAEGGDPTILMKHALTAATGTWSDGQKALISQSDIGQRDFVKETINATVDGNALESKTSIRRLRKSANEVSTAALRKTDRFAATASWFAYYEQYMIKEEGHVGEVDAAVWNTWGADMNRAAAAYSSLMVSKDQNISSKRDASNFNNLNKGKFGSVIQMLVIPFANFMINKKMNMAIDFRGLGDPSTRAQSLKSLGGTALEISAFHGVSNFVLMPLISILTDALLGADEEEDNFFDKEFRSKMFFKGMVNDMNPLVLPIGPMEYLGTKSANYLMYLLDDKSSEFNFADRDFSENFAAWERLNGLPIFDEVGRSDIKAIQMAKQAGVYGNVLVQYGTSVSNIKTLNEKNPYITTKNGAIKYVEPEEVKSLLALNATKIGLMTTGAATGLFAKETVQIIDRRQKQVLKRATSNENLAIAKMIVKDNPTGRELFDDKLNKANRTKVESAAASVVGDRVLVSAAAEKGINPKYINTIRSLTVMSQDPRDVGVYVKHVMETMKPAEALDFYKDFQKYYALKKGENALIDIEITVKDKYNK